MRAHRKLCAGQGKREGRETYGVSKFERESKHETARNTNGIINEEMKYCQLEKVKVMK